MYLGSSNLQKHWHGPLKLEKCFVMRKLQVKSPKQQRFNVAQVTSKLAIPQCNTLHLK